MRNVTPFPCSSSPATTTTTTISRQSNRFEDRLQLGLQLCLGFVVNILFGFSVYFRFMSFFYWCTQFLRESLPLYEMISLSFS